LLTKNIDFF
jgi:hypothetical protein